MTRTPLPLLRSAVYGEADADLADPAELYHEASRLYPALAERQGAGIARLLGSQELRETASRPVRINPQRPVFELHGGELPEVLLRDALRRRRSAPPAEGPPLRPATLACLLDAGYGETREERRTVPSGGALYPLEL